MENLYGGLHSSGQTLETATTLRLPTRPQGDSNPSRKAFEDFGSSLAPRSSSQAPAGSKFKPARTVSREQMPPITIKKPMSTIKKPIISIKKPLADFYESDGSEDELDLLSSSQADESDEIQSKKTPISKAGRYVDDKGKGHNYDPKFPPSKSSVLSKLKFTKIKSLGGEDNNMTIPMPSSSSSKSQLGFKENSQDFGSWVNEVKNQSASKQVVGECSVDDDVLEISSPLCVKSSNQRLTPPRPPHKQPIDSLPNIFLPPRPRLRPPPRPTLKSSSGAGGSKPSANAGSGLTTWSTSQFKSNANLGNSLEQTLGSSAKTTMKKKYPSRSPSPEISISTPKTSPKNFPMDMISPLEGKKVQSKPLPKPGSKIHVNPPSLEASRKLSTFPMPSPQSSDKARTRKTSQSKGKIKPQPFPLDELDEDGGGDEESDRDGKGKVKAKGRRKSGVKPRTFPMSTQMLASIGHRSPPKQRFSKHQKRLSEDRNEDEPQGKKKRQSSLSPSKYTSEDESDSISISPDTDPRTLCPFCDTPLPSSPSPSLINILTATRKKCTCDPRPSNPLGLKAPLAIFIVVCERHKFESQILPEAERKGWPKTIQWQKLGARVERMKGELLALIEDPGGEHEIDDDVNEDIDEVERLFRDDGDDGTRGKTPKARSIFWTEVMDEVKKKGSRAVVGLRGQFANFEKTQPGYYGEQGSVIIHQTLFDMFPPASFDPARISPLTSNEFVSRILVPEVALRLIMEDRDLEGNSGMHQALIVLRESSAYGVAMFPEDGGEGSTGKKRLDVMGVGDKIVMERARKRRKELEEEEEQEEREEARRIAEMEAGMEMEQVKEKEKTGSKKKRKRKQKEEQQFQEQQAPVERPRPRPCPTMRASSSMSVLPPSDHEEETPLPLQPSHKSPRKTRAQSRTRSMYSGMDTEPSDDFSSRPVIELSTSDSDVRQTSEERRRSPSASESKSEQRKDKARKTSSTRAASRDLMVLSIGSDSDASIGSRKSTKSATRRSSRVRRTDSTMDVDFDEDDVGLEIDNVLDITTPVRQHGPPPSDERTPKPLILPQIGGSMDIKPLMQARMRQTQKNNPKSRSGEADMSRRTSKLQVEDTTDGEDTYKWLLNDTSQSSMGSSTSTRRR